MAGDCLLIPTTTAHLQHPLTYHSLLGLQCNLSPTTTRLPAKLTTRTQQPPPLPPLKTPASAPGKQSGQNNPGGDFDMEVCYSIPESPPAITTTSTSSFEIPGVSVIQMLLPPCLRVFVIDVSPSEAKGRKQGCSCSQSSFWHCSTSDRCRIT